LRFDIQGFLNFQNRRRKRPGAGHEARRELAAARSGKGRAEGGEKIEDRRESLRRGVTGFGREMGKSGAVWVFGTPASEGEERRAKSEERRAKAKLRLS